MYDFFKYIINNIISFGWGVETIIIFIRIFNVHRIPLVFCFLFSHFFFFAVPFGFDDFELDPDLAFSILSLNLFLASSFSLSKAFFAEDPPSIPGFLFSRSKAALDSFLKAVLAVVFDFNAQVEE